MKEFMLHERLKKDTIEIGDMNDSRLLLFPDEELPWVILVPLFAEVTELYHLEFTDQIRILKEVNQVSKFIESEFIPSKMNIGTLGNIVPQLHIHIIARYEDDRAWPNAVWATSASKKHSRVDKILEKFQELL